MPPLDMLAKRVKTTARECLKMPAKLMPMAELFLVVALRILTLLRKWVLPHLLHDSSPCLLSLLLPQLSFLYIILIYVYICWSVFLVECP